MRAKRNAPPEPIPESFPSLEAAAEFWDHHDFADYWDQTEEVKDVDIRIERRRYLLALEPTLARKLSEAARQRGVSCETLVNLWLSERLQAACSEGRKD